MRTVPSPDAHGSVTRAGPFHPLMRTAVPRCERFRRRGPRPVDKPFFLVVGARIAWHRSQNRGTDALQRSFTRVALGAGRTTQHTYKTRGKDFQINALEQEGGLIDADGSVPHATPFEIRENCPVGEIQFVGRWAVAARPSPAGPKARVPTRVRYGGSPAA